MAPRERATFDAAELAVVLSHYDLGVIESITDFPRGSRRSPKVGIVCQRGKFLLKRRALARAGPERVRFTHRVQKHLTASGFPAPALVPTSAPGSEALQLREHVYELFEFIAGQPFRQTVEEARDAGAVLARFHDATEGLEKPPDGRIPRGDYHDAQGVRTGLCSVGSTLNSHDSFSGDDAELAALVQVLLSAYDLAAASVNAAGFESWPVKIIHSDWHPGNLLFKNDRVVAVIDYDTVRVSRRLIDVANGALQFSMIAGGEPGTWPDELDEARFRAFLSGYGALRPLGESDRRCIPALMTQALITECVAPITETGSVGRWSGYRVLQMVRRKIAWLERRGDRLMSDNAI
ncbi:MAG: phosphotransferase enzyme family protein [Phycisphaerae bacterium]